MTASPHSSFSNFPSPASYKFVLYVFLPFMIVLMSAQIVAVCVTEKITGLRMDVESLRAEKQALQDALLQIRPAPIPNKEPATLIEQDFKMDSGTLVNLFKVEDGVYFGIASKNVINGAVPVWYVGTKNLPEVGSTVSFLHHFIRFKDGTEVLAFSKVEPNL